MTHDEYIHRDAIDRIAAAEVVGQGEVSAVEPVRMSSLDVELMRARHSGTTTPNATARMFPSLIAPSAHAGGNVVGPPQVEPSQPKLSSAHSHIGRLTSFGVRMRHWTTCQCFGGSHAAYDLKHVKGDLTQVHTSALSSAACAPALLAEASMTKDFAVSADTILYDSLTGLTCPTMTLLLERTSFTCAQP